MFLGLHNYVKKGSVIDVVIKAFKDIRFSAF